MLAGAGAAWHRSPADGPACKNYVGFNGRIAAAVKDFACFDRDNFSHVAFLCGCFRSRAERDNAMGQTFVQLWPPVDGDASSAKPNDRFQQLSHGVSG